MSTWRHGGVTFTAFPRRVWSGPGGVTVKLRDWNPRLHPRDDRGRFARVGDRVSVDGQAATFRGVNRDGSVRVSKPGGGESTIARSRVQFDRGQGSNGPKRPAADKPAGKPKPQARAGSDPERTPPSVVQKGPGVDRVKVDMNDSMRNSVRDLGLHEGNLDALSGQDRWAAKGARALVAKQPISEREARALADEVRYQAQRQGVPKRRATSLRNAAEWLESAAAQLVTYLDTSRIHGRHTDIDFDQAQPGDRIAIPGRAEGAVDVAEVVESVKWYGVHKYTLKLDDDSTVTRYVGPSTPVRRLDPSVTAEQTPAELKAADQKLAKGSTPVALYDYDYGAAARGQGNGPGAFTQWSNWYEHLAQFGDDFGPIPVAGVTIQDYMVDNGIAWRSKGRSYLIELKPGESVEDAKKRGDAMAGLVETSLRGLPEDMLRLQKGVAHLQGRNPKDAHWEKTYNMPNFVSAATGGDKSTTFWANTTPQPSTIRHEFSHSVDHHSVSGMSSVSKSSLPVAGQGRSWESAAGADVATSRKFQGKISETHGGHRLVLGQKGVSSYGMMSRPAEDFAEAGRLWITDRIVGSIGRDRTTGQPVRFADVFPARALILDKIFGESTVDEGAAKRKGMTSARRIWMNELRKYDRLRFHVMLLPVEVARRTGLTVAEAEQALEQARAKHFKDRAAA